MAEKPLVGSDGLRWLVIAISSNSTVHLCPAACPEDLGQALAEALEAAHACEPPQPLSLPETRRWAV